MKKTIFILALLIATMFTTAQQIVVTGSATPIIIFDTDYGINYNNGDQLYSYFNYEGVNYASGKSTVMPNLNSQIITSFLNDNNAEVINGAPVDVVINIAYKQGEKFYKLSISEIFIYTGTDVAVDNILAKPLTIYKVNNAEITNEEVELAEVPWIAWYNSQCPRWKVNYNSTANVSFQTNYVGESILRHKDGRVWKIYSLGTYKEMPLKYPRPDFCSDVYYKVVEGDGHIVNQQYFDKYVFSNSDYDRGYVKLEMYANRFSGCTLESDPKITYKITLLTLPEPSPDKVLIKEADPPVNPDFVEVYFEYDKLLQKDEYVYVVVKNNIVNVVNHLNKKISITFKLGNTNVYGGYVNSGSFKATNINLLSYRFKNKTLKFSYNSFDNTVSNNFEIKL